MNKRADSIARNTRRESERERERGKSERTDRYASEAMVLTEAPVAASGDIKIARPLDMTRVSEMSSRLEEGWTLLNQTCPVPGCHTALLRDNQKNAQGEAREPPLK